MRPALLLLPLLALTACGQEAADPPRGDAIDCALGSAGFQRQCTFEQRETADGLTLILRRPDGGFRRLLLRRDGRGAIAADGVEQPQVTTIADGRAEVAIGGDRYRLPATVGRPAAR
jgi:hypothetical protein